MNSMAKAMEALEEKTAEFIKTFGASLDPRLWIKLVREELREAQQAFAFEDEAAQLKETVDLLYVQTGLMHSVESGFGGHLLPDEEAEALVRLLNEAALVVAEMQGRFSYDQFFEALNRVHASNMSKLGDDGKPIKREDGKILKGPNYKEPDLSDLV